MTTPLWMSTVTSIRIHSSSEQCDAPEAANFCSLYRFRMSTNGWLPTPAAAQALGCSQKHLKNKRDSHGGFLVEGVDYRLGCSVTAPITWNVERCRDAFHYRGKLARQQARLNEREAAE